MAVKSGRLRGSFEVQMSDKVSSCSHPSTVYIVQVFKTSNKENKNTKSKGTNKQAPNNERPNIMKIIMSANTTQS